MWRRRREAERIRNILITTERCGSVIDMNYQGLVPLLPLILNSLSTPLSSPVDSPFYFIISLSLSSRFSSFPSFLFSPSLSLLLPLLTSSSLPNSLLLPLLPPSSLPFPSSSPLTSFLPPFFLLPLLPLPFLPFSSFSPSYLPLSLSLLPPSSLPFSSFPPSFFLLPLFPSSLFHPSSLLTSFLSPFFLLLPLLPPILPPFFLHPS